MSTTRALYDNWIKLEVEWDNYSQGADVSSDLDSESYDVMKVVRNVDVLPWFQSNLTLVHPWLQVLARTHLGRPISTAYQERFFSVAGNIVSPNRISLGEARAEKLQLLKHNWALHSELGTT